jgi:putative transport protein
LFAGLLFGHFDIGINHEILEFVREFGLILFVYTIGLQVGPGFIDSLKSKGLLFNSLAASVVIMGILITLAVIFFGGIQMPVAVGMFSGATTNTPSLGAAQQAIKDLFPQFPEFANMPGLGYAVAYPFGVVGTILSMLLVKLAFKVNPKVEADIFQEENKRTHASELKFVNLIIKNSNFDGLLIKELPLIGDSKVVITRILHQDEIKIPDEKTVLHLDDIIYVVGEEHWLHQFQNIIGEPSTVNLLEIPSDLTYREIILTNRKLIGKTLDELKLRKLYGVVISRIHRGDTEFTANTNIQLHYGDSLRVVGGEDVIKKVEKELGNSADELNHPNIIFIFIGILVGVIIGSIPIQIPGLAPLKLGLAGGPLIVALLISRLPVFGSLVSHFPSSSNLALREMGIVLFLACVGLKSGDKFMETLLVGDGFLWMGYAAIITLIPLAIVGILARIIYKVNFMSICGLLAGSMTDPPALAFANAIAKSNAPSMGYATVYPLVMILRIVGAQLIVMLCA